MPTTTADDDDPVIASYDVYISANRAYAPSNDPSTTRSKLLLLQYPAHRQQSRPYNAARLQKPTALRLKPETGLLEVDVPILTHEHYNTENGVRYQKSLKESKTSNEGAGHGLAAGFNTLPSGAGVHSQDMRDIATHSSASDSDQELETQTLGGKIVSPTTRDPVYMLGTFHNDQLHLSHLDALIQVRPQLHHIDAQDELNQKKATQATSKAKPGAGEVAAPAPKLESKAIDVKLKDNRDDSGRDRLNTNARLLLNIQKEHWQTFDWTDEADEASRTKFVETMHLHLPSAIANNQSSSASTTAAPKLKSVISNGEWLDKMSAPRETGHGKKGLLAKLRGRERERARRKKNDGERRRREKEASGAKTTGAATGSGGGAGNSLLDMASDGSDLSSLDGSGSDATDIEAELEKTKQKGKGKDIEMVDLDLDEDKIEIKEEPASSVAAAPATVLALPESLDVESAGSATKKIATPKAVPKRRGRSLKDQPSGQLEGAIDLGD